MAFLAGFEISNDAIGSTSMKLELIVNPNGHSFRGFATVTNNSVHPAVDLKNVKIEGTAGKKPHEYSLHGGMLGGTVSGELTLPDGWGGAGTFVGHDSANGVYGQSLEGVAQPIESFEDQAVLA